MLTTSKQMKRSIILVCFLLCYSAVAAALPPSYVRLIDLPITARVDTADADVKAVYDLVRHFLSARPDSLYDNPYWNEGEKKKYPEPYPARRMIFQSEEIIKSFPPLMLSIEKEGEYYCARVLFYREGLAEPYRGSNPWAIARWYAKKVEIKREKEDHKQEPDSAKKDNKEYRLFDPLQVLTQDWRHERIGPIDYYFPFNFYFDHRTAHQMGQFCRGLRHKYGLPDVEPIEFYICRSVDELAQISGLDFILGPTSGRSLPANAQVFSALGNEWYPHEIVHLFFRDFKPHYILMEGVATYEGGSLTTDFDTLVVRLAEFLDKNDSMTFQNFLDSPYMEGGTTFFYTFGAVLCKMADQKGGPTAVKALLEAGNDNEQLYQKIESVLGIPRDKLTEVLRAKVKEYTGR